MSEVKTIRINKVLRELNISLDRAVEQLGEHGFEIEARPTSKISHDVVSNCPHGTSSQRYIGVL